MLGERLFKQLCAVADGRAENRLGVTGDKQNKKVRTNGPKPRGEFGADHLRHGDVSYQKSERLWRSLEDRHRIVAWEIGEIQERATRTTVVVRDEVWWAVEHRSSQSSLHRDGIQHHL